MTEMSVEDVLILLQNGTIEIEGLLPWSSNYAFLVRVCDDGKEVGAVYKPQRGERPLWDFPQGTLCQREMAAYLVSEALGWHLIPPTVLRAAEHGIGSIQFFIHHDPEQHYFTFQDNIDLHPQIQKMAMLDLIINNADRKAGHILLEESEDSEIPGRIWGIDHGICFHEEPKLRTVIWEFAGTPIPDSMKADMSELRQQLNNREAHLTEALSRLLSSFEITALNNRIDALLEQFTFPLHGAGRQYPWPPV